MDGVDYWRSGISFVPLHLEEKRSLLRLQFRDMRSQKDKGGLLLKVTSILLSVMTRECFGESKGLPEKC